MFQTSLMFLLTQNTKGEFLKNNLADSYQYNESESTVAVNGLNETLVNSHESFMRNKPKFNEQTSNCSVKILIYISVRHPRCKRIIHCIGSFQ